jgi:hypothetical protein
MIRLYLRSNIFFEIMVFRNRDDHRLVICSYNSHGLDKTALVYKYNIVGFIITAMDWIEQHLITNTTALDSS